MKFQESVKLALINFLVFKEELHVPNIGGLHYSL